MKYFLVLGFVLLLFLSGCTQLSVCGNGICESGEDENSCAVDCSLEVKGCSDFGGTVCGDGEICSGEVLRAFKEVVCCLGECEGEGFENLAGHECNVDSDCDDGDLKTAGFCKGYPRKCAFEVKSCAEIGGAICDVNSSCEGELVNAKDELNCCVGVCEQRPICEILNCAPNEKCFGGRCVLKTCEEQEGEPCILPKYCLEGFSILSPDVSVCCPKKFCVTQSDCEVSDGECTLGCVEGDPDCSCTEQDGTLVAFSECSSDYRLNSKNNSQGLTCCSDPYISTTCEDSDGGINFEEMGICVVTAVTESGENVTIFTARDSCTNNEFHERYCTTLDAGPASKITVYECGFDPTFCNSCGDGVCNDEEGEFTEDRVLLQEGNVLTGLAGKNSLEGQTVSVKLVRVFSEGPGSQSYSGESTLFDEQGAEVHTVYPPAGTFLNKRFIGPGGLALKTSIYINSISVHAVTGIGAADLTVIYVE